MTRTGRVPQLVPYQWDPGVTWLRRGATSMWIDGHGHGFYPGQQLLIDTVGGATATRRSGRSSRSPRPRSARIPSRARPVTLIRWRTAWPAIMT